MTFEVPAAKASFKQNRFEFTIPGDKKTYSLPKMQYISAEFSQRFAELAPALRDLAGTRLTGAEQDPETVRAISELQHDLFEHYVPGIYAKLSADQIGALADAWREESTVGLGESQESAQS